MKVKLFAIYFGENLRTAISVNGVKIGIFKTIRNLKIIRIVSSNVQRYMITEYFVRYINMHITSEFIIL